MKNMIKKPLLFSLLFIFISAIGFTQSIENLYPDENLVISKHTDWAKGHYKKRIKVFKETPLNMGEIIFIGNSITEGGNDWAAKFGNNHIRNRGIGGDITDGILERLDEITYYKPKAVFLLIGINDLHNLHDVKQIPSEKYVAKNIIKICRIIHKKSPKTKIFVQTILPASNPIVENSILNVNEIIKQKEKINNYTVIDLNSAFLNDEGYLKQDLTYDGLHLNEQGYEVWVEFLKPVMNTL